MKKIVSVIVMSMVLVGLTGCAATTMIKKRNLDTQTKMSATLLIIPSIHKENIFFS
jgi:uncharacterized protein YcfL